MSYRVRRKFTSSKFCIDGKICKIFIDPKTEYEKGFYLWNVDWGDGSTPEFLEPKKLGTHISVYHTYESAGIYEITG